MQVAIDVEKIKNYIPLYIDQLYQHWNEEATFDEVHHCDHTSFLLGVTLTGLK